MGIVATHAISPIWPSQPDTLNPAASGARIHRRQRSHPQVHHRAATSPRRHPRRESEAGDPVLRRFAGRASIHINTGQSIGKVL